MNLIEIFLNLFRPSGQPGTYPDLLDYPEVDASGLRCARSVVLRHLDCGSCGGCELALQRLTNPVLDIQKYNINFEASPRHAYALIMTGPFTAGLQEAALTTLQAMPVEGVVAFGDCAVNKGVFTNSYALAERPAAFLAGEGGGVLLSVPGCPPDPAAACEILLKLIPRI